MRLTIFCSPGDEEEMNCRELNEHDFLLIKGIQRLGAEIQDRLGTKVVMFYRTISSGGATVYFELPEFEYTYAPFFYVGDVCGASVEALGQELTSRLEGLIGLLKNIVGHLMPRLKAKSELLKKFEAVLAE